MRCPRLSSTRALQVLSPSISWKPLGKLQQTIASEIVRSGIGLHSGVPVTARLFPATAGEGRYLIVGERDGRWRIPATIDHAVESPLCTTLAGEGVRVRTVEHLLSALEACGVDNCGIEIRGGEEVPALDGSAQEWVEAIEHAGLCVAKDSSGGHKEKMAPFLLHPKYVWRGDSFIIAFPSSKIHITCGINFPQVEILRKSGLIQGGSTENAIVCSATAGWLNPPLHFDDEPCRHKVLDLVGDFSLFARKGNQGLPLAHIIAYKAGHSLHAEFLRRLSSLPGAEAEHANLQLATTGKGIRKERGKESRVLDICTQKTLYENWWADPPIGGSRRKTPIYSV